MKARLGWLAAVALGPVALTAVASVGAPVAPSAAAPKATPEQTTFFEKSVRPVLLEQCGTCHGDSLQQGGLRIDSRAALLKGGKQGAAVVPGKPEASLLIAAINHQRGLKMPPGKPLSARAIAELTRWVKDGAVWPEYAAAVQGPKSKVQEGGSAPLPGTGGSAAALKHWAFRPVSRPAVPRVKNQAWVKTPVDAFILAGLEAQGLKPAPAADRRTLLRRVTFDLTGLPPTPEEVQAFVGDRSADAWSKVVERLLASPAYGERWGRHWLDVARYSDSNGMDENVHYGNAWRYRDWVVNAFNSDKPYDRLIVEQLAGDLLPADGGMNPTRRDNLIATGFLSVGPKVISEVDTQKMLMDMVDEQVDTTGRVFMGLTMGCARCHDHKFDPLSTEDYYALAGILKSTKTMDVLVKPRMWHEESLATAEDQARKAAADKRLAELKSRITTLVTSAMDGAKKALPAGATLPANPEATFPAETQAELKKLRDEQTVLEKASALPMAMAVTEGQIADLPVHIRGDFLNLGKMVPRRFPVILAGQTQQPVEPKRSGRLELAQWLARPDHPLTGRVAVNRVWRWHFGRGIVPSTDNFGRLGELPSHPELLDWLAGTFTASPKSEVQGPRVASAGGSGRSANPQSAIRNPQSKGLGWSLKSLHRLILSSSVYQMSSAYDARAAAVDPENKLRWRAEPRRLEAEEIRDSLLAVSGQLDRSLGGTLITLKNREYFFDHTSKDGQTYDTNRRSLYIPIVRNHLYDMFQVFDFGDAQIPEGNRPTTTVAPQALFALNSKLILDASEGLAQAIIGASEDDGARVQALYSRVYGRLASAKEVAEARQLLTHFEKAQGSAGNAHERMIARWAWLAHTRLAANEFIYLR